jgi:monomeric sarcosine oxidase
MGIFFETLSPADVSHHFPQFRLDDGMDAIFQPDAGLLRASLCVRTHVQLAQELGAEFLPNCPIQAIHPGAEAVMLETAQGRFSAARLVIATGSWAGPFLASLGLELPLQPTREQVFYFDAPEGYKAGEIPIFIAWGDKSFYGIGSVDGSGIKAAQHGIHEPTTPQKIRRETDPEILERVRGFLRRHMPALAENPVLSSRVCLYTMTPDEHFIIDRHPEYPYISFGAGFSGHGFKFSTLVGKMLVEIASGQPTEHDLSLFRVDRFQ